MKTLTFLFTLLTLTFVDSASMKQKSELLDSINNVNRTQKNIVRDKYRNPQETLSFFEIDKKKDFRNFTWQWILY